MRRRQERDKRRMTGHGGEREKVVRDVHVPDAITVQELANRMAERVAAVVKTLMQNGIMATQNQTIDPDTAALIVEEFGHKVVRVSESRRGGCHHARFRETTRRSSSRARRS